jgi:hypothetical protein
MALVVALTEEVVTVNVAEDAPPGTVTEAGALASALLDVRLTVIPICGAAPLMVTKPVEDWPPYTEAGERDRPVNPAGFTVNTAERVPLPRVAPIVTLNGAATVTVPILNVAEVPPAGIDTVAGTVATEELEERAMTIPPEGAGALSVAVPVETAPPITTDGVRMRLTMVGGLTVNTAVAAADPTEAFMVAFVEVTTVMV